MNLRLLLCALCVLCGWTSSPAQSLRFFATPFEVYEGDAVVFNYLEADRSGGPTTVPLAQIDGWRWDFNGDGVWDEEHDVDDLDPQTGLPLTIAAINATWYSALDARAVNGVLNVQPKLQIRRVGETSYVLPAQVGVSEDVFGTDGGAYPAGVDPLARTSHEPWRAVLKVAHAALRVNLNPCARAPNIQRALREVLVSCGGPPEPLCPVQEPGPRPPTPCRSSPKAL